MGVIRIYPQDEINFDNNGICIIEPSDCIITRNLNEFEYSFELHYPISNEDKKWQELEENRIIRYFDNRFDEYFRINLVQKTRTEIYIVADQIFINDSKNNFIEDTNIVNQNCNVAINQLLTRTQFPHQFTGSSNIGNVNSARIVRKNLSDALLGDDENTILSRWGGEFDVNRFSFKLNQQIGQDRGVEIRYGKNLTSIQIEIDMSSVATRIMPYGFDGLMLDEKYVDSPYIDNYAMPIIQKIDYDDIKWKGSPNYSESEDDGAFETKEEAQSELKRRAELEYSENKIDLPEITFNVDFIELSKTEEYKGFAQLLLVDIGDTVTIKHKQLGIDIQSRVMSYEYNCLTESFNSVSLGSYKQSYLSSSNKTSQAIEKMPEQVNTMLQTAKDELTQKMNSALGGYVLKTTEALYIMDSPDINTAQRIWVWNINGLSYSSNGINGPFDVGITMDGSIVANFITTGVMSADRVRTGNIVSSDDTLNIDLNNNYMSITSSDSENQTIIDANGMEIQSEGQTLATFREKSYIPYLYADDVQCPNLVRKHSYAYNYYVNGGSSGSDLNNGLTESTPFKTVQYALDILPDLLEHDVTIHVSGNVPEFRATNKIGNGLITIMMNNGSCIKGNLMFSGCNGVRFLADTYTTQPAIIGHIAIYETRNIEIDNLLIDGSGNSEAIYVERSTRCHIANCKFKNATNSYIKVTHSTLFSMNNAGNSIPYYLDLQPYAVVYFPNGNTNTVTPVVTSSLYDNNGSYTIYIHNEDFPHTETSVSTSTPTYTISGKTQQWNCNNYYSKETLSWNYTNYGVLKQGYVASYGTGRWEGYINFDYNNIKNIISGGSSYSGRIYMKRSSSKHGQYAPSTISLYASDGTAIDTTSTLALGEAKWINIPSSVIEKIANGTVTYFYVKYDYSDVSHYIIYDCVCKLEITYSK